MLFSSSGLESKMDSPVLSKVLFWASLFCGIFLVVLWVLIALLYWRVPVVIFAMSPLSLVVGGPLLGLSLLPPLLVFWLTYKKQCLLSIIIALLTFGGLYVYGGNIVDPVISQVGLVKDDTPSGILVLSENSIPPEFSSSKRGETKTFSLGSISKKYYVKEYYKKSLVTVGGEDWPFIRLTYNFDNQCPDPLRMGGVNEEVRCGDSRCWRHSKSSTVSAKLNGEWKTFQQEQLSYYLKDNNSCAEIFFSDKSTVTQKEIYEVIDSLKRTP